MAVMIGALGIVFGAVLNSPMSTYLPFLTIGLIMWTFMSSVVQEGCTAFTAVEGMIRQMPIPFFVYVLRMFWRNTIILAHNFVIFPFVCLILGKPIGWEALFVIPGFLLVSVNLLWVSVCAAVLCTRFRDFTPDCCLDPSGGVLCFPDHLDADGSAWAYGIDDSGSQSYLSHVGDYP